MHVKINLDLSLRRVMWYHERKVSRGQAECLYAGNFLKDAAELTRQEKMFHFERLQSLNERVTRKTLQVILSWHQGDQLDNEKMRRIAREYMEEMGFGQQPYLVYRHRDSANPHVHIVSTNIRQDGTKLDSFLPAWKRSFQLSRELEHKYGLYETGRRVPDEEWARLHPVQKVVYGKTPLKPTMNSVLEAVLPNYNYTSLEELNVILRQYNIVAARGEDGSVTRKNNGLLYFPLNDRGQREKIYIKSSALKCRPTLQYLGQKFVDNGSSRGLARQRLTTTIDWIFFRQRVSQDALQAALEKEKISMVRGEGGLLYYLDELHKTVFEGEQLGRGYTAEGIRERCVPAETLRQRQTQQVQRVTLRQRQGPELY